MSNPTVMRKNVLLVVNPIAGGTDKDVIIESIRRYGDSIGYDVELFETTGDDDEKKIQEKYRSCNPERVLVTGGDGTVKMVGEALVAEDVVFGLIPSGSANGLAVDLNFPKELEQIIPIAFSGDPIYLDMILINGHRSIHLSDIGLNAELIKNYENGSIRGKLGYALQSINTLTDPPIPFHVTIKAGGKTISTDAKMLVIANSQRYGTGVTINPLGKMDDGKFEIVIIKNLDLWVFGKIVAGKMPLDTGEVEIITTKQAEISTDVPVHFQVDGEYIDEVKKLKAEILHHQMKIAAPKPAAI